MNTDKENLALRPVDEIKWLEREARIYRDLTIEERVAWFRDLEHCVQVLAGEKAYLSTDGDHGVAPIWRDPLAWKHDRIRSMTPTPSLIEILKKVAKTFEEKNVFQPWIHAWKRLRKFSN